MLRPYFAPTPVVAPPSHLRLCPMPSLAHRHAARSLPRRGEASAPSARLTPCLCGCFAPTPVVAPPSHLRLCPMPSLAYRHAAESLPRRSEAPDLRAHHAYPLTRRLPPSPHTRTLK